MACVSRFSAKQKTWAPLDMTEREKDFYGVYKAMKWTSPAYHVPLYPDWQQMRHVAFRELNDDGQGCIVAEEPWTIYHRQKHQVRAAVHHPLGTLPSDTPQLNRYGHKRDLPPFPPMSIFHHRYFPWPKRDAILPTQRFPRGDYYTYYHDAFQSHRLFHHRLLPLPQRVEPRDIPRVTDGRARATHYDIDTTLGSGLSPFNHFP